MEFWGWLGWSKMHELRHAVFTWLIEKHLHNVVEKDNMLFRAAVLGENLC